MKKILITGATGFIGRNCLSGLLKKGYEVHAVCPDVIENVDLRIKWHKADLLKISDIRKLVSEISATHLLHFAWYAEPKKYWNSPENFKWVEASIELLKWFYSNGGRRAVLAGTCAEYDWHYGICYENTTPLLPATVYGRCKHELQVYLSRFSEENDLSSAWGRVFFLYGPNENQQRIVASVISSLLQGREVSCSHGNQIRDFLHVADVAGAFVALLESDVRETVNIGSGQPITLKEVISKIGKKLNRQEFIRFGEVPVSKDDPPLLVANVRRLKDEVGWSAKYDIDSGLNQTIEWWKNNLERKL